MATTLSETATKSAARIHEMIRDTGISSITAIEKIIQEEHAKEWKSAYEMMHNVVSAFDRILVKHSTGQIVLPQNVVTLCEQMRGLFVEMVGATRP